MTETDKTDSQEPKKLSVLDLFKLWYPLPALLVVMVFMFKVRTQSVSKFITEQGVMFSGSDAWYHLRAVTYTVKNWPFTMPYDVWTQFPTGIAVGQFGTLYDQIVATAALIIGLGDPSQQTIAMTLLYAPAVFGALVVIPTYYIAKQFGGKPSGVAAAVVMGLLPGTILQRSVAGFSDHHIAEAFFMAIGVLAFMYAFKAAEEDNPIWELVTAQDFDELRRPLIWSAVAGIAVTLYIAVWPPGALLVGIVGLFLVIRLSTDFVRDVSPDYIAFVGAVSMAVATLLLLPLVETTSFSVTRISSVHILLTGSVSGGSAFMAGLARFWETKDLPKLAYPGAIGGGIGGVILTLAVVAPSAYALIISNLSRTIGFGVTGATATISEARPLFAQTNPQAGIGWYDILIQEYGLTWVLATFMAFYLIGRVIYLDDRRADYEFAIIWTLIITAAAFTQIRFNYYLAIPVAVFSGHLVGKALSNISIDSRPETHHVLIGLTVVIVVFAPLLVPITIGASGDQQIQTQNAISAGVSGGPGDVVNWQSSMEFLRNDTPEEGTLGGADNRMDPYGTYHPEENGDYSYPDGAYGVASWWDYGHWITTQGERIPNANPFQGGANTMASYLLAPSEEQANAELNSYEDNDGAVETRYVMVDWQMVEPRAKFLAPVTFDDNSSREDYIQPMYDRIDGGNLRYGFTMHSQRYYDSQMVRMYEYHGSAMNPRPYVVDWDPITANGQTYGASPSDGTPIVKKFDTVEQAREYAAQDESAQVGGIGPYPTERVDALENHRLVHTTRKTAFSSGGYIGLVQREITTAQINSTQVTVPAWVKTFERVPGATVDGTARPNTTVKASVEMMNPATQQTFTYKQYAETGADGQFNMTVPYSTTGYDNWGPKNGYTNVSVRATGPYTVETVDGEQTITVNVPEAAVIGEETEDVTVTLSDSQEEN